MIEDTVKKVREIQAKIQAAQDRQKSYADLKRREEEFEVGDKALLKVSPMKGISLISQHVLQPETIELDQSLTYEEIPIKILDSKVCSTRNKEVKIVKVLWSNQEYEKATWEAEDEMKKKFPELFKDVQSLHVTFSYPISSQCSLPQFIWSRDLVGNSFDA
ncbi:uncharacterized protein LOC110683129 [Chenopodium quinoa]|uniref:uncharacterized protein LOC110683129 n=1 Tax=Chenopodium quinoa TaxID=63459 RepID=UPI000B7803C1|nr:uncharacterized protein LOC110683129 [Chenopodium quinoa]